MALIVRAPGTCSQLVDLGRPGHRGLGVPAGGAFDQASYLLGSALIGNPANAVALEITLAGPALEATAAHGVVVFGATFDLMVDGRRQGSNASFTLHAGEVLECGLARNGLRGYLCAAGGFRHPRVLDSGSAFAPLKAKDLLECVESQLRPRSAHIPSWTRSASHRARVLWGGQWSPAYEQALLNQRFEVTPQSNRMGVRLRAAVPLPRHHTELVSAPVCPGTIQLPHDGQPIVLGVDAQTIGGYPRLAHVIAADWDKLAQWRPGDEVGFEAVSLDHAAEAWQARADWLRHWQTRLRASLF